MRRKSDHEMIQLHGGKYALVMGVTRRAKQLTDGARPLVEQKTLNHVATSLEELSVGRIQIIPPELPTHHSPLRSLPTELTENDA